MEAAQKERKSESAVKRGKDGHISLALSNDDFFSDPFSASLKPKTKPPPVVEEDPPEPARRAAGSSAAASGGGEAQTRFAGAKSISSDKYYARD